MFQTNAAGALCHGEPLQAFLRLSIPAHQLAVGGVAVGLAAGMLTRRLLRLLRWFGASASQVGSITTACGHARTCTAGRGT